MQSCLFPHTQQATFAQPWTKPSFIFTPLVSGAVFSHTLPKASLSSVKSLLLLSRFLSTATSPWGAAPMALEQTIRKLRTTPSFHSPCQKCTAKALE